MINHFKSSFSVLSTPNFARIIIFQNFAISTLHKLHLQKRNIGTIEVAFSRNTVERFADSMVANWVAYHIISRNNSVVSNYRHQ